MFSFLAVLGFANVGLWFVFFVNKAALVAAIAALGANVFFTSLVTLGCSHLADETIAHKVVAVSLGTFALTFLGLSTTSVTPTRHSC